MSLCTTCPYCGVGCGVVATVADNRVTAVVGDPDHPANWGKLCVKGSALADTTTADQRLTRARVDGVEVGWDSAMDATASRLQSIIQQHGPGSVAMYLSGQLMTEDYYVANKLMKGFIGSPHVDTNSRLCMSSTVAGYKRALGADAQPCSYKDLELAQLVILVGSNAAWNHPILYRRLEAAKTLNPDLRVVLIDPRATASADIADLHLAIRPGTDSLIFNAILAAMPDQQALNSAFIIEHTRGFEESLAQAIDDAGDLSAVANQADIAEEDLKQLVDWFCATEKVLTLFSQGVNQSSSGTDKVNSIINCHLASGRLGRPGMGPFSLTGQPNAMGGREVGGLANMLAAHMDPTNPDDRDTVRRFWNAPNLIDGPGHKAIDLFNAIEAGQIKAVWIMATNPAVSLPDVTRMRQALIQCELVIVSDCMAQTDSLDLAHIALPATGWSEKDGTVTNSERRISRQPALVAPMGDARHDWQAMCDVAKRLGFGAAFDYASPADIFREHARLSGFENHGTRIFDISGLADLSDSQYQDLRPIQWPVNSKHPNGCDRLFGDGQFATPDGRARLLPIKSQACLQQPNADYPLIVNSGRIRDQWHTMTRTGRSARLLQHRPEPFIEINPADVVRYGLQDGHLARLTGRGGQYAGRVRATQSQRIGEVFVPMHWTRQFASQGCSGNLYQAITDPISGQPESKHGIAHIAPIHARWEARLIARNEIPKAPTDWWAQVKLEHSVSRHLAGETPIQDWPAWCQQHLSIPSLSIENKANQQFRAASIVDGQLQWVLIVQPSTVLPDLEWLDQQFDGPIDLATRARLLTATGADDQNSGGVICSCFQVRQGAIEQAIAAGQDDIDTLGRQLKCGTNCGSCIPELNALISASTTESAPMA